MKIQVQFSAHWEIPLKKPLFLLMMLNRIYICHTTIGLWCFEKRWSYLRKGVAFNIVVTVYYLYSSLYWPISIKFRRKCLRIPKCALDGLEYLYSCRLFISTLTIVVSNICLSYFLLWLIFNIALYIFVLFTKKAIAWIYLSTPSNLPSLKKELLY